MLQMVGCSHHQAPVEVLERLAFSPQQTRCALEQLGKRFPGTEAVLLSTCNRVELYTAAEDEQACPAKQDLAAFLAEFHDLSAEQLGRDLVHRVGEETVLHLFTVVASLDSMVVGEAQILSQVKQAYELATGADCTGPQMHAAFQAAMRVAKRVASETAIHERREICE